MSNQPFASFPVFNSFPELDAPGPSKPRFHSRDRDRGGSTEGEKYRKDKKRGEGRDADRKHHKEKHTTTRRDIEDEHQPGARDAKNLASNLYFRDAKGDELNITYGYLEAKFVPKYREIAGGKQILGLKSNLSVLYKGSKGIEIGEKAWYNKAPQLSDSKTRAQLANENVVHLEATAKTHLKYIEVDGFIRLPSAKGKEREAEYRSITRDEQSSSDSSNSDMEESSDEEYRTLSAREEAIQKLERQLNSNPTSVTGWLMLLQESIKEVPISSKNAEHTRAEVSISVLERALAAHPDNKGSPRLRLKLLRLGEILRQRDQLEQEWERTLRDVPSEDLYVEWLDWRLRTASTLEGALASVLDTMRRVDGLETNDFDRIKLRIFWRVAIFFQQAGYSERGFALFQAQAELTFSTPEMLKQKSLEERLDALEEFWDSEALRVGEEGARGWAYWKSKADVECPVARAPNVRSTSSDAYDSWHAMETKSDECLFLPRRMQADEANEGDIDPYATIIFMDIRSYLFDIHTDKGRQHFRLMWLSYLGLYIPGLSTVLAVEAKVATDDRWADSPRMRSSFLENLYPEYAERRVVNSDSFAGVIIGREKAYEDPFDGVRAWGFDAFEPFIGLVGEKKSALWSKKDLQGFSDERLDTIRNVFIQLKLDVNDVGWDVLRLAFEAVNPRCHIVQKLSQAMLADNSSSPTILAAHAQLERLNGKFDKARKVYRIGIDSLSQANEAGAVHLLWGLVEMEWLRGQEDTALATLYLAAGQKSTERAGIQVLRAKRRLEELSHSGTAGEWRQHLQWSKLRILFELLTGGLEVAMDLAAKIRENTQQGTSMHEAFLAETYLIFYHYTITLRNHAKPALLRDAVSNALKSYPDNSVIFGLFLECEKGESIWGRVKALVSDNLNLTLEGKSVSRCLLELWTAKWEVGDWAGEVERIRSGFEAAVVSNRTKGSPILWKAYALFEIAAGEPKKAKAALFRAIRECPFVKDLYMLAFDSRARSAYSARELAALSDTMAERGIRVRRALDEVLEEMGGQEEKRLDVDAEEETELEQESRERRRLMPY